jgi:hypothetical protein
MVTLCLTSQRLKRTRSAQGIASAQRFDAGL